MIIIGSVLLLSSMEGIEGFDEGFGIKRNSVKQIKQTMAEHEAKYKQNIEKMKNAYIKFTHSIKGKPEVMNNIKQHEHQILEAHNSLHMAPRIMVMAMEKEQITHFDHKALKELMHHMVSFAQETEVITNMVIDKMK